MISYDGKFGNCQTFQSGISVLLYQHYMRFLVSPCPPHQHLKTDHL